MLLLVTLLVYPASWSHQDVRTVCGQQAGLYSLGDCEVRWAFILAIIATFDGFILGEWRVRPIIMSQSALI